VILSDPHCVGQMVRSGCQFQSHSLIKHKTSRARQNSANVVPDHLQGFFPLGLRISDW